MLEKYKKIYLKKVTFLWSFCAVVCIVPILITTIKYKKILFGVVKSVAIED